MFQLGFIMMKDIQCGATCKEFIFPKGKYSVAIKREAGIDTRGAIIWTGILQRK